ncbi:rhodanese-like domain-containing protein [Helicobacter pametensis]|uniref:rhodanese-like domain-containing protein n=1 Tax=Helicobacter pametensis TaxID=95149 RepID=UPI0004806AE8|nr:rhodanese-like domain-containing protein [Helicobacter pametensis]
MRKSIYWCWIIAFVLVACSETQKIQKLNTQEFLQALSDPQAIIIDTRDDSFYNGFREEGAKRGGHIKGAIQFSASWLDYLDMDFLESFAEQKGISKEKRLVFYDSDLDHLERVSAEFASRGYQVGIYTSWLEYVNGDYPLESFENFIYSVSPQWVYDVIEGKNPQSYQGGEVMIFEVSWGELEDSKDYKQHIKGAYHFNTDWIEEGPIWNFLHPDKIVQNLLKQGITSTKTIILYSSNQLAAYRVFLALKWVGVRDVRVMNGNLDTWINAGFSTENKKNIPIPQKEFGAKFVDHRWIIQLPQGIIQAQKEGLKLVSVRSWEEYIGEISGYSYIPRSGEPAGAIWGFGGSDASNMADYYDPDGTLRNPLEIFALWREQGIDQGDQVAFYCGTGWRAGVAWFMTQLVGWKDVKVYDGGWNAWQMDESLPVQIGAPKGMSKPDAKNNYGKVFKLGGASCKE